MTDSSPTEGSLLGRRGGCLGGLGALAIAAVLGVRSLFSSAAPLATIEVAPGARLEAVRHWTGGFSGYQHDEYLVYYVRPRGLLTSPEQAFIGAITPALPSDIVDFRRVDEQTIEFVRYHNEFERANSLPGEVLMRLHVSADPEVLPARK